MTEDRYRSACAFAGRWLAAARPWPEPAGHGMMTTANVGVYIICDWAGRVVYVGSTTCGIKARVAAHLRDVDHTLAWTTVWTVPLRDDTPAAAVRRIEGLIGRALRPTETRVLP